MTEELYCIADDVTVSEVCCGDLSLERKEVKGLTEYSSRNFDVRFRCSSWILVSLTIVTMCCCTVARSDMLPVGLLIVWMVAGVNLVVVIAEAFVGFNIQITVLAVAITILLSPKNRAFWPDDPTQVAYTQGTVVMLSSAQAVGALPSQEYYRNRAVVERSRVRRMPCKRTKELTKEPVNALKCWYIKILPHRVRSVCWG